VWEHRLPWNWHPLPLYKYQSLFINKDCSLYCSLLHLQQYSKVCLYLAQYYFSLDSYCLLDVALPDMAASRSGTTFVGLACGLRMPCSIKEFCNFRIIFEKCGALNRSIALYLALLIGFSSLNGLGFSLELFRFLTYRVIHQLVWFDLNCS
jgi:hypothetical protein